jgi:hypothetical protein
MRRRKRGQKNEARHRRRCTESEVHEIVGKLRRIARRRQVLDMTNYL